MAITVVELQQCGDELAQEAQEVRHRAGVSRLFYAAMHRCFSWQAALPGVASIAGPAGGMHQLLINRLRNPDPQCTQADKLKSRKLAAKLDILKQRRVAADYDLASALVAGEVALQRHQTAETIQYCDAP